MEQRRMGHGGNMAESRRKKYPRGTRLRLTADIDDPYTPKKAGDIFTVSVVDDAGQIHGSFASGGSMALLKWIRSR